MEINLRHCAYLGDAVWELHIRQKTILMTENAKKLHELTTNYVKTAFQVELLDFILERLREDELEIVRRARNLPIPVGRRSMQNEYRLATAFEALIGFWFLNNKNRLEEIFNILEERLA